MAKHSAGILIFRRTAMGIEVFLVHPGGPYWAKKDAGAWSVPKGECEPGEDGLAAARRELAEETGLAPQGDFLWLGSFRQSSAKTVEVWAVEGDADPARLQGNSFTMEWPPRSGQIKAFPEVDRAGWFTLAEATRKLVKGQAPILSALSGLAAGARDCGRG
jgi:predicted NUDIX family NTP pyrophosphohydrolase